VKQSVEVGQNKVKKSRINKSRKSMEVRRISGAGGSWQERLGFGLIFQEKLGICF
jgi:hypothetical protein